MSTAPDSTSFLVEIAIMTIVYPPPVRHVKHILSISYLSFESLS